MMRVGASCLASASAAALLACGPEPITCEPAEARVTYQDVKPIFDDVCASCHATTLVTSAEREKAPRDVNYDSYLDAQENGEDAVEQVLARKMPSDDPEKLTKAEACLIKAWVDQGMLEQ